MTFSAHLRISKVIFVAMALPLTFVLAYAAGAQVSIAYIGCSNTADTVRGYYSVPNKGLFWQPYNTGGGSLDQWANPTSGFWSLFDQQVQRYGQPSKVWIQICERAARPLSSSDVQEAISNLRQHAPSATFYISPLNSYSPPGICALTGPNGVADSTNLANQAVSSVLATQGPSLGPLTPESTQPDMCHPNVAGAELLGSQVGAFFDGMPIPEFSAFIVMSFAIVFTFLSVDAYAGRTKRSRTMWRNHSIHL